MRSISVIFILFHIWHCYVGFVTLWQMRTLEMLIINIMHLISVHSWTYLKIVDMPKGRESWCSPKDPGLWGQQRSPNEFFKMNVLRWCMDGQNNHWFPSLIKFKSVRSCLVLSKNYNHGRHGLLVLCNVHFISCTVHSFCVGVFVWPCRYVTSVRQHVELKHGQMQQNFYWTFLSPVLINKEENMELITV